MSVQYRSQFALACAEPDCARLECPPQPGRSGEFTVCAAFWPQHADGSGLLIRQGDGLALGYSGGNIYMEVPGAGRASSVPQDSHLIENEWNIAGAVYSGGAIQLYLNGRPVAANLVKEQENACRAGTATTWDLGVFNGYLQRISFYDRGLSEAEMCRAAFAPLPDVALGVDFNGYLPRTSGTQPSAVRPLGKCDTVNLVRALHPGRMGCALSIAGIPPVSGGFTLLAKCYLRREERGEREFLLSAGVRETPGFMGLALCDERKTLSFFLAGGQLSAPVQLVLDRWVDLAVSVENDGKAALYVDGVAVGSGTLPGAVLPTALMLGNAQSAGGTLWDGLAGVMDSAALFSAALGAERLRSCAEDGLTVFAPSLEALWLFSEGDGTEQKHGGALAYSGGAAIEDCRNTVLDREPPELTPVLPEAAEKPDDMSRWEAGMVASVFNAVIQEVTGTTGNLVLPLSDSQVQAMEPVMQAISSQTISSIEKEQSLDGQDIKDMVSLIMAGGSFVPWPMESMPPPKTTACVGSLFSGGSVDSLSHPIPAGLPGPVRRQQPWLWPISKTIPARSRAVNAALRGAPQRWKVWLSTMKNPPRPASSVCGPPPGRNRCCRNGARTDRTRRSAAGPPTGKPRRSFGRFSRSLFRRSISAN